MINKNKKLKVLELFAGCGGLSDGFLQSGFYEFHAFVEWERPECQTLSNRIKKHWPEQFDEKKILRFDIRRTKELICGWLNDPDFDSHVGLKKLFSEIGPIDIMIGGPPCQAYSIAGRIRDANGMQFDYRNFLFESYLEVVRQFDPRAIVFENVPGILSAKPGGVSIIDRIANGLKQIGFETTNDLRRFANIDLHQYGVPQNRRRIIIVALNKKYYPTNPQDSIDFFYKTLLPTHKSSHRPTVRDALGDLSKFYPSKEIYYELGRKYSHYPSQDGYPGHVPRFHNKRDIQIFEELALDNQSSNRKYSTVESLKSLYTRMTGKTSNVHKYHVLRWDKPSNTIPAHLFKDGLRHIHPDPKQARSLTVREAARLQTFDDDFEFLGSQTDQYRMIGNAVPPVFALKLSNALYELLKESSFS